MRIENSAALPEASPARTAKKQSAQSFTEMLAAARRVASAKASQEELEDLLEMLDRRNTQEKLGEVLNEMNENALGGMTKFLSMSTVNAATFMLRQ